MPEYAIDEQNIERQRLLARALEPATVKVLSGISLPAAARCADLGCGIGETTRLLSRCFANAHWTGIDRDPALLYVASSQGATPGIDFREGDALGTPAEPGTLDFVFTRYLLTHLPEPGQVIRNMFRSARKGGIVMAVEPDFSFQACYPSSWAYERIPGLLQALLPDPFIGRKLVHLFRDAGATDIRCEAHCEMEAGSALIRRTWRMTIEAMGPAIIARGILSATDLDDLLAELRRAESDDSIVFVANPNVFVWGTA